MARRPESARSGAGRPPATSREEILTAARDLVDRDGWKALTIRKLAASLGVGASTLYHHVRDRDDLLVQLLNDQARKSSRLPLPTEPRERIIAGATFIHDSLAAAPWAADVLTADDLIGEASLWMVEAIVGGAIELGFPMDESVALYRMLWYYTAGEILVRAHSAERRESKDGSSYRDSVFRHLDPVAYPNLSAAGADWSRLADRDTYLSGLQALVDGALSRRTV